MDNLGLNRLNFANIVDKHLRGLPETTYFSPTQVNSDANKWSKTTKNAKRTMYDNLNIQGKIDSIVAYVHTQLKDRQPSPKSKPIPRYAQGTKAPRKVVKGEREIQQKLASTPENTSAKPNMRAKTDAIIIDNPSGNNQHIIIDNPAHRKIGIPRIKVLCSHKEKKRLHHTIPPPNDDNHYVNQQRFEEAKRQNELFESMLQDQKQLQLDRRSLAQEFVTMRSYLDDIRGRLDSSLKMLDDNKTYSECNAGKGQTDEKSQPLKVKRQNQLKSAKKQKSQ